MRFKIGNLRLQIFSPCVLVFLCLNLGSVGVKAQTDSTVFPVLTISLSDDTVSKFSDLKIKIVVFNNTDSSVFILLDKPRLDEGGLNLAYHFTMFDSAGNYVLLSDNKAKLGLNEDQYWNSEPKFKNNEFYKINPRKSLKRRFRLSKLIISKSYPNPLGEGKYSLRLIYNDFVTEDEFYSNEVSFIIK